MIKALDNNHRAYLAWNCSKIIAKFIFHAMALYVWGYKESALNHEQALKELQVQLHETCHERMIQVAERRQHLMGERHAVYLQYELQALLDEASMTANA